MSRSQFTLLPDNVALKHRPKLYFILLSLFGLSRQDGDKRVVTAREGKDFVSPQFSTKYNSIEE